MISVEYISAQPAVFLMVVLGALLVATALHQLVWKSVDKSDATLAPGLPLLGNALALGRHGVSYINKCRRKFGDCFTLSLAGVKMTFLFEPVHIEYFFSAPDEKITFRPAVEQFTQRVFGLTSRVFFPLHFKMLTELRHLLVPGALTEYMQTLGCRALQLLPCYVHHSQVDLYSLCRGLVFHCAVETVFGAAFVEELPNLLDLRREEIAALEEEEEEYRNRRGVEGSIAATEAVVQDEDQDKQRSGAPSFKLAGELLSPGAAFVEASAVWEQPEDERRAPPRPPAGIDRLARTFFTFEECFELAASPLPHALQPEFVKARGELLRVCRAADQLGLFKGTPAGELLDRTTGLPPHLRANLLLALMWASQANTIPAVFWSTAFLLLPENAAHKAVVLEELQRELQASSLSPGGPEATAMNTTTQTNNNNNNATAAEASTTNDQLSHVASTTSSSSSGRKPSNSELVAAATRLAASRRSVVSRCVSEALRLRVQSIDVRQVASPLDMPSESRPGGRLRLPRGRLLAVCPFESHHDRKLWGAEGPSGTVDPWLFNPNRPELRLGDGSTVLYSAAGLAFGGGPYRCPGRFFAEQELGLLVQLFLWSYDMTLSYADTASPSGRSAANKATMVPSAAAASQSEPARKAQEPGAEPQEVQRPAAASSKAPDVDPHPQLRAVQGGSLLYSVLALLLGPSAMAWGFGWFDGLDGPMQEWRESGDPAGLLPPCDLRRLVGVKVPRKPCWVQLGRAVRGSNAQRIFP